MEIITGIVAVLALLLSGTTAYYQFLRRVNDVRVSLLEATPDPTSEVAPSVVLSLAFFNNGDRLAILKSMRIETFDGCVLNWVESSGEPARLMITLEPGSTVHDRFRFVYNPQAMLTASYKSQHPDKLIDLLILFELVDWRGNTVWKELGGTRAGCNEKGIIIKTLCSSQKIKLLPSWKKSVG